METEMGMKMKMKMASRTISPARIFWMATLVCAPSMVTPAEPATAQVAQLKEDARTIIDALTARGITDSEGLLEALNTAWVSDRSEEYGILRTLGISLSDGEFDAAWQNQPNRAAFYDLYDLEMWATDVLRSWGKVNPRKAFSWLYATRSQFGYSLAVRQCFQRVTGDWARTSGAEAEEAERYALALTDRRLRDEAIAGVMWGSILRGDGRRIDALMAELVDEELRSQVESLYEKYF